MSASMLAPADNGNAKKRKFKHHKTAKLLARSRTDEIKKLADNIVKSKKQCNTILKLFDIMKNDSHEDISLACIRSNHKIFCYYLEKNELQKLPQEESFSESSEVKLRRWLRERYSHSVDLLIQLMVDDSNAVRELALCTLMKYLEAEGKKPLECSTKSQSLFPIRLFENIVASLLVGSESQEELIERFQEYLEYDDVRFNYMKHVLSIIKMQEVMEPEGTAVEIRLNNILSGLLTLSIPEADSKLVNYMVPVQTASTAVSSAKVQRELCSKLWLALVKLKLTSSMYKKILIALPDKVIPNLHDPMIVSDWLISCYDRGGAVSLMALNGLFVLMTKHNLEYPAFYNKLYNVMGNEIFSAKYKARFFHLLDLFLQSLLLPMSIIAAFIKKLSRMALTAPPSGALLVIELIINLLVRHDMCRILVHRDTPCDLDADPYLAHETDIAKCRATESSLWEIKTLQKHWHHRIASQALRIEKPLPQVENVLDDLLETNYEQLMEKEIKKSKKVKAKEASGQTPVPINHKSPTKLLDWESQELRGLWMIQEE